MKGLHNQSIVWLLFILLFGFQCVFVTCEVFTLGYLTGSQRRPGNLEYPKPGKTNFLSNWSIYVIYFLCNFIENEKLKGNSSHEKHLLESFLIQRKKSSKLIVS